MLGRLIVVTGTGTEIGKTHLPCALVRSGQPERVRGIKPIESGVSGEEGDDGRALRLASGDMFHVKHGLAPYLLRRAVSPHLAAREEGRQIAFADVERYVAAWRADSDVVFVELAGGMFSPLVPPQTNADLARMLAPDALLVVAPDRLGVLHDVGATLRAAASCGTPVTAVALVCPATRDASTGSNRAELQDLVPVPVFEVARGDASELARSPAVRALYAALVT